MGERWKKEGKWSEEQEGWDRERGSARGEGVGLREEKVVDNVGEGR